MGRPGMRRLLREEQPALVADLGATYVRVAQARGGVLGTVSYRRIAEFERDPRLGIVPGVVTFMRDAWAATDGDESRPAAIGLGVPAAVDGAGAIHGLPELGLPAGGVMRDALASEFGCPVAVDNDANMAVLGEFERGAGRGTLDFVLLTLGTNIGMGVIVHGQVFRGAGGGAGEAGMLLVPAVTVGRFQGANRRLVDAGPFGRGISRAPDGYAWIEELVGGGALAREATGPGPDEETLVGGVDGGANAGSARVFELATHGDSRAVALVDRAIEGWSFAIAELVAILDPDAIALAGGLVEDVAPFLERFRARAAQLSRVPPRIIVAELGAQAGLVGAEVAARRVAATQTEERAS
jgi:glucokinase